MSGNPRLWAVVPVGRFATAKRRLMSCLMPHERAACARAMLEDVLSALTRAPSLAGIMVITGDASAAALAQASGAVLLADTGNSGIGPAVELAARYLAGGGQQGMLVIPADLPLLMPEDIERIAMAHRAAPSVTLVPASVDGGTNALACSPPDAMRFCFGADSYRRHLQSARACGIEPQALVLARVGHDIDRPDDIAAFLRRPSATRTHAYLSANGIAQRLRRNAASNQEKLRRSIGATTERMK